MGVKRESKHELAEALRAKYWAGSRREKKGILDHFIEVTGYHRKHAIRLMRKGKTGKKSGQPRRGRSPVYGPAVLRGLQIAAEATGWMCGKRLGSFLAELIPALEREGALCLEPEVRKALLRISASTIDRRLAPAKARAKPRGLGTTKPGSLLKRQIPVRTFTPWDEQHPGFVEMDLVAHCGDSTAGSFLYTIDVVEIATGWTECLPIANKSQVAVFDALKRIRDRLPFPLLGIDCDNGSEFINNHLLRYCQQEKLTFTRCRAYHKDDQAHVEENNWSAVRQHIGYDRYDGDAARAQMEKVEDILRVYLNAFQPVMKLVGKERECSKVRKRYDVPRTPYRRALEAGVMLPERQQVFEALVAAVGPQTLRRRLDTELDRLWALRGRQASYGQDDGLTCTRVLFGRTGQHGKRGAYG